MKKVSIAAGGGNRLLATYLKEIRESGGISKQEMMEVFIKYRREPNERRKAELHDFLFRANLPLVVFFVKRWFLMDSPYAMDLIQEGNLGLHRAIEKFDPTRRIAFSVYASNWIWVMMHKHWRNLSVAASKVPMHIPFKSIPKDLHIDLTEEDSETGGGGSGWLARSILIDEQTPEELTAEYRRIKAIQTLVSDALDKLTPRERIIIQARLMPDREDRLTLENLGDEFSRSRERIRQLERIAIEKLRKFFAAEGVTDLHNLV